MKVRTLLLATALLMALSPSLSIAAGRGGRRPSSPRTVPKRTSAQPAKSKRTMKGQPHRGHEPRRAATPGRAKPSARMSSSVSGPARAGGGGLLVRGGVENVAPRGATAAERELQQALDGILDSRVLKQAVNGVHVIDAVSGTVLYSFGADRQLNPASNVKLVSTATALDVLGADFVYRTRLVGPRPDAQGVIHGDLHLVGAGDPTFRVPSLSELAAQLHAAGITRVTGDLLVGRSAVRDAVAHAGISITIEPGEREGHPARVSVYPPTDYIRVAVKAKTSLKGVTRPKKKKKARRPPRPRVTVAIRQVVDARGEHLLVTVGGKIRKGQRVRTVRAAPRPTVFTGHVLRSQLQALGVTVEGRVRQRVEVPAAGLIELAVHESAPLATLVARINKPSSNYLADRVIASVGASLYGGDPSVDKGVRAMQGFLDRIGIGRGSYRVDNGSGLSYTNHLSARQIVEILMAGARDIRFGPEFIESLAIGGRDGTLRGRFRGRPSAGWVRGKTGTLTGVSALSGFVSLGGDDTLCFAILTNDFRNRRKHAVRAGHAAMVDAMHRYLVRREALAVGRALAEAEPVPGVPDEDSAPVIHDGVSEEDAVQAEVGTAITEEQGDVSEPSPLEADAEPPLFVIPPVLPKGFPVIRPF